MTLVAHPALLMDHTACTTGNMIGFTPHFDRVEAVCTVAEFTESPTAEDSIEK